MIKDRIEKLIDKVSKNVYERDEEIRLTLLAAVAGESIFFIGAPGVAKSLIARRLKHAFQDGKSFEYLMNRFSTPDEIFGPVAISKLKKDKYERVSEGYLPNANVAFLDEIWKAGPSIQNTLLTIINEKVYRNGSGEKKVPLRLLISASNELPEKDAGLEALWDRFLIRCSIDNIRDTQKFNRMIADTGNCYENHIDPSLKITEEEYQQWSKEIDRITIPQEIFNTIQAIRNQIKEYNDKQEKLDNKITVSDRRWKKIIRILRTSAFLNERKSIDLMDCFLVAHCIWNKPEQIPIVKELVSESVKKHGYSMSLDTSAVKEEIKKFDGEVKNETTALKPCRETLKKLIDGKYYGISQLRQDGYDLILKTDFDSLTDDTKTIRVYKHNSSCAEYGAKKSSDDLSIDISCDYYNHSKYSIQTHEVERTEKTTKKPHPKLAKAWDDEVNSFLDKIQVFVRQVEDYRAKNMGAMLHNLFVDGRLSNIVESNLRGAVSELDNLKLDVERIKHYYVNLQ